MSVTGDRSRQSEPRWPATIAVFAAIGCYLVLPGRLTVPGLPRWVIPGLEAALAIALLITSPQRDDRESQRTRLAAIVLIALINAANVVSLVELISELLKGTGLGSEGRTLILDALPVWATNVIVFALWFWEADRGGPAARVGRKDRAADFQFPQMALAEDTYKSWLPNFFDYLYTSFTNATAFSPTDTMPLSPLAKLLMMIESSISLLTVAIVISRAVNILK